MSVLKFTVGRSGAGGANSDYITRLTAAEGISFHNLKHLESEDLIEARTNAMAYAETREEIELARNKNARTHYRIIISWEGKESSEKALEETKTYLEKQFPDGKAIIAVHQNTNDTHTHVWLETRKTDGKKIQIKREDYEALDERWTEQYDATYGTSYAPHYKALKEETKQWKRDMYEWRKSQKSLGTEAQPEPIKPERAADRKRIEYWRAKEMQETGALKDLPKPVQNESIHAGSKIEKEKSLPAAQPSEKDQIIERKVDMYLLDLKAMMRAQRDNLINEVKMICCRNLVRKGIPTDWGKIGEFAAASVDHITEKGAEGVRAQIKYELQQGSHLSERLTLEDKSASGKVQSILNAAAENTRQAIATHAFEGYEQDFLEKLYSRPRNEAQGANYINKETGIIENEKSGFGTDHSAAQGRSRSIESSERNSLGTQSGIESSFEPARSGDRGIEKAEQSSATASRSNDENGRDGGNSFYKSETNESSFVDVADEQLQGGRLYDVSNARDERFTGAISQQESFGDEFYQLGLGKHTSDGRAGNRGIQESFPGIENFTVANINPISSPEITIFEPNVIANQNAFATELMEIVKQSLAAQNINLSPRAEKIYEFQLKKDETLLPSPAQIEMITKLNQNKSPEDQISTEAKSKLEVTYEAVTKADEEERDRACAMKALSLEKQVRLEELKEQQEFLGFSMSM